MCSEIMLSSMLLYIYIKKLCFYIYVNVQLVYKCGVWVKKIETIVSENKKIDKKI